MEPVDLRAATAVLVGGVTGILAADVWLMARGLAPVTESLRTKPGRVFLVLLTCHVVDVLGPLDPFRAVAGVAGIVKRKG